ncbi:hypothetical protein KMZ29_09380 [Bradyrhizobium sediminis]|uniref:Uncharacterized protein n=1 Tax=Bradyrhizobium sediminis TaxID=2840469 RepID=A0A975NHW1_9BRAD|nr:hypothetical protein [Bradyrhizobium sediminis]QWG14841.1 hypothetical protein KMZ29_09380 [Bradyrhizobium sediminis]
MAFAPYSGTFEQIINELLGPKNIIAAASKFAELEKQHGPYSFGKFIKYFLPNPQQFASWEKDSGGISEPVRRRLTEIVSANLKSASPLPMLLKVGENVDDTHDLIVKTFAHNGHIFIGLHMLCPNPELK